MLTVFAAIALLITGNGAQGRDIVSYWAAAHTLAVHHNPYGADQILQAERSVGFPSDAREIIMRNPPWALPLVVPLALVGLPIGSLIWSLCLLACLIFAVRSFEKLYGKERDYRYLFGYSFAPALLCVLTGQTSLFVLVGLILFLRLHQAKPFLAGLSLWLCALKPHLFLPLAAVLLVWILLTRNYVILVGALTSLAGSSALAFLLDPHAWSEYFRLMRTWGIDAEYHPCLSVALRFAIKPDAMWLQYFLAASACVWAVLYFWKHRQVWNWAEHGYLVLMVSISVAPYAWLTDQAVLIPVILAGSHRTNSRIMLSVLALASAAIEVEALCRIPVNSSLYLWTSPAWFAWYLWTTRAERACVDDVPTLEMA
jgi:hypothetical protein